MNRIASAVLGFIIIVLGCSLARAQVPQIINYQGRVLAGSTNFTGSGQFKFALVNTAGTTTFWSNDNTSVNGGEPTSAVSLGVSNGLYSVLLGDTDLTNMTAIPASVFNNSDVRLRVWFNDGTHGSQLLSPDQRIASVGYATIAGNVVDGAITAAKIANGAVGDAQIDSTTVQKRVTGAAPSGQFIRSINADGTVVTGVDANSGGTVTSVSASSPLTVTNATTTPSISLSGTVGAANGGTGLSSPGASGNLLQSNGTLWTSVAPNDGVIGNEVTNTTNSTLTRSGSGTAASPFTLALNTGNANTWTATQTLQTGAAASKALIVQGAASQSANLQEWQSSTGTVLGSISSGGVFSGDGSGLTLGQNATMALGTGALSVANTASPVLIPGLTQTIMVPANSFLYIQTEGGIQTTASTATGFSGTDISIGIDGVFPAFGMRRVVTANNGGFNSMINSWNVSLITSFSTGFHTINVRAAGASLSGGATATVSGASLGILQGKLNVFVIKQ